MSVEASTLLSRASLVKRTWIRTFKSRGAMLVVYRDIISERLVSARNSVRIDNGGAARGAEGDPAATERF